jgi:hypothetical protein
LLKSVFLNGINFITLRSQDNFLLQLGQLLLDGGDIIHEVNFLLVGELQTCRFRELKGRGYFTLEVEYLLPFGENGCLEQYNLLRTVGCFGDVLLDSVHLLNHSVYTVLKVSLLIVEFGVL